MAGILSIQKLEDTIGSDLNKKKKSWEGRVPKHPTLRVLEVLGGDPPAGSPTGTLLRLNPPCLRQARIPQLKVASPTPN